MLDLPVVTDDFDGQCAALDGSIRAAAIANMFYYEALAPVFLPIEIIPDVVAKLVRHYTLRGFNVHYDGILGKLTIAWDHPSMNIGELAQINRAIPAMVPNLGIKFRAGLLYLCMTNNTDLRDHSDVTMQRELDAGIKAAAALGNTDLEFGFPDVPAPVVQRLFAATFQKLQDKGFMVLFDVNSNMFIARWGNTLSLSMLDGSTASVVMA
jgi:hypothetical protein